MANTPSAAGAKYFCPKCGRSGMSKHGCAGSGRARWACASCDHRTTNPKNTPPEPAGTVLAKDIKGQSRFVITSAQNNTQIFERFHQSLRVFAEHQAAKLMAVMVRYSNPDAMHKGDDAEMRWPDELKDILVDRDMLLCQNLLLAGDVKIGATLVNPLGGQDMTGRKRSVIFGHNQLQMRMVATSHNEAPKQMITTGSVSLKNYGRSSRARKASENHNHSALYVETNGPRSSQYWCYQLEADKNGGFYFLDEYFTPEGVTAGHRPLALFIGDEHEFWLSDAERKCLWGEGGIVPTLKPEKLIRNDVYDHFSGSHHHRQDHILRMRKHVNGYDDVQAELLRTVDYLNKTTADYTESYVLDANHNDHFSTWLNWMSHGGAAHDLRNAVFYHEFMGEYMAAVTAGDTVGPFEYFCRKRLSGRVRFVSSNQPLLIGDIDNSQHGHRGCNGARGGKATFSRSVNKMNTGHSHTSFIEKGAWGAGTSALVRTLRAGVDHYAKGLSSWTGDDILIYPNHTRTFIPKLNGWWRAKSAAT